jgi:hypothetical protein
MPLSTSNSESRWHKRNTDRSIFAIVLGILFIMLASEGATVFGIRRISKIMRRTTQEYRDSEHLKDFSESGTPTMLLLGNSLLLEGVDYPTLRSVLSDEFEIHRLVFEQTEYLDQYYVLRRLFRHGARPQYIVLFTSVNQFIDNGTRGDFMSRYIDSIDIISLGRRQHAGATALSSSMFAHWSEWFAYRAETRKVLLGRIMPDVGTLAMTLGVRPVASISPEQIRVESSSRLKELKELCDQYGSRLAIVVPPLLEQEHADDLKLAGKDADVRVLIPVPPGTMHASLFRDGFHLNAAGAAIFTAKLRSELAAQAR